MGYEKGYEKLLFNFILDNPKPLFRAGCSLSPVLNFSLHFVGSVFGRSKLHGKLMGKAHSAIAVFFRKVGRRSNLSNDGLSRLVYLRNFILRFFFGHKFEHLFGCVRITLLYTYPLGREFTLAYWHVGNCVGGPEVFEGAVHQWSGVASSNCSVVHLPGKELRSLAVEIPNLAIGLIEGLTFKGKCYSALAQMLGTRSITQRLSHLLLHLVELYGVEDADGRVIAAAFTHADIAHMVGATRQWVTISLKRMQEKGILQTRRSQIVVCRTDVLEEMRGHASD